MLIDEVKIQAYRSLYDVILEPGSLTVIVGPNNAGKTNAMEALHFLGEVYEYDLETAINRNGGFENIAHRRMRRTKLPVTFQVTASTSLQELFKDPHARRRTRALGSKSERESMRLTVVHEFAFKAASAAIQADYAVTKETVRLRFDSGSSKGDVFLISRDESEIRFRTMKKRLPQLLADADMQDPIAEDGYQTFVRRNASEVGSIIGLLHFNPVVARFVRNVANIRLYQLSPLEVRKSGVPTPNVALGRYGANLPALVSHMTRRDPESWSSVMAAMQRIVPSLEDIRTAFTPDRRLTLQFVEEGAGRPWGVEEVSDGTIQSLALFSTVLDDRLSFLLMEEPENSVHPWILRVLVDLCRSARDKQVLISTHSPVLIDYLSPDDVVVVWRNKGRTNLERLTSLEPDAHRMWEEGEISVFDLIDTGLVRPAVPGGLE